MKRMFALFLVAIFLFSFSVTVFGADMPVQKDEPAPAPATTVVSAPRPVATPVVSAPQQPSAYPAGPIQKAERGFMNAVFGWTEVPKRIVDKSKEYNNPLKGFVLGTFQGTCKAFARTASGLGDIVTFPIGGYEKPGVMPDMPAAK